MLDLYFWTPPNGYKVAILLEELVLMPVDLRQRYQVIQWLMFQMGNLGCSGKPIISVVMRRSRSPTQSNFTPEKQKDSIVCSTSDWAKLNFSLATTPLLIWRYPWLRPHKWQGQDISTWPNLQRWYNAVRAVQRGLAVMSDRLGTRLKKPSSEAWNVL